MKKYYGVYGFNGGGVYDNWSEVLKSRPCIQGIKNKKFNTFSEAVAYIVSGLCEEYGVADRTAIKERLFYTRCNWFFSLDDICNRLMPLHEMASWLGVTVEEAERIACAYHFELIERNGEKYLFEKKFNDWLGKMACANLSIT